MHNNWRTAIGYICIMLCVVAWLGLLAWIATPTEFTIKIEMDNNTREAIESIEYPIVNYQDNSTNFYDANVSNSENKGGKQ